MGTIDLSVDVIPAASQQVPQIENEVEFRYFVPRLSWIVKLYGTTAIIYLLLDQRCPLLVESLVLVFLTFLIPINYRLMLWLECTLAYQKPTTVRFLIDLEANMYRFYFHNPEKNGFLLLIVNSHLDLQQDRH